MSITLDDAPPKSPARQQPSHRGQLLKFARESVVPGRMDAIVVPTARPYESLKAAVDLAGELACVLVALCSRDAAADKIATLAEHSGVAAVTINVTPEHPDWGVLPKFKCDELLDTTPYIRHTDVGFKRNFGLYFALLAGWRRVFFLDDDIEVAQPDDVRRAATLLRDYPAVSLELGGFPDNSVVCHANRAVGRFQDTFIGGGAMAVDPLRINSFYPKIYNEDWFFLVGGRKSRRYAVVGHAEQADYDPYDTERAKSEEFGDCIGEGVYALLDNGTYERGAHEIDYWAEFLTFRRGLIKEIMEGVDSLAEPDYVRERMRAALTAAREQCETIDPKFCVEYLTAWRADRLRWLDFVLKRRRLHLAVRPTADKRIDAALSALSLADRAFHVPARRRVATLG